MQYGNGRIRTKKRGKNKCCDHNQLKGDTYSGVPRFIAETLNPSTAKRDRTEKMSIYETAGVEEYWIVSPQGTLEIYYLEKAARYSPST